MRIINTGTISGSKILPWYSIIIIIIIIIITVALQLGFVYSLKQTQMNRLLPCLPEGEYRASPKRRIRIFYINKRSSTAASCVLGGFLIIPTDSYYSKFASNRPIVITPRSLICILRPLSGNVFLPPPSSDWFCW